MWSLLVPFKLDIILSMDRLYRLVAELKKFMTQR